MGCDIHCFIEHSASDSERLYWTPFGGHINPGRDYGMFGLLAGVRSGDKPVYEVRGVPEGLAYEAVDESRLYISADAPDEDGNCSPESAERWVNEGSSKYTDERKVFVTHPDWHSHSWLTPDEWEAVLAKCAQREWGEPDPEYYAMLAAMRCLESKGRKVRVVFWFDN